MAVFKGAKNRDDTFVGGGRPDRFLFDPADLTSGDVIVGGDGKAIDTLKFTTAGAISSDMFAGVSGIERIELSDEGNSIILTQTLVNSAEAFSLTVDGGGGDDLIDASAITDERSFYLGLVRLSGGDGNDTLIGGADRRLVLDGGTGSDTIEISAGLAIYDRNDQRITATSDQALLGITSGISLDLTREGDQTAGDQCVVTGFLNVDASASSEKVTLVGGDYGTLIGGSGADTITGGTLIKGGGGRDTIVGGASDALHIFELDEGDFAAHESITGRSGHDWLMVTGSVDFRTGALAGMETIWFQAGSEAVTQISVNLAQLGTADFTALGEDDEHSVHVDIYLGRSHVFFNYGQYSGDITVHGTDGRDTITGASEILAGGGNDSIGGGGNIDGGEGDDIVDTAFWTEVRTLDGGTGNDTLRLTDTLSGHAAFNLGSGKDQSLDDTVTVRGFENLDLSTPNGISSSRVIGSSLANVIAGSAGIDVISGGGGDDVLDGGFASDTLKGGAGADTFFWSQTDITFTPTENSHDTIKDFMVGEDHLKFAADAFHVSGKSVDAQVVSDNAHVDLRGIDLFIYTGGELNDTADVASLLASARTSGAGLFVSGTSAAGDAVLFYTPGASGAEASAIDFIADFGRNVDALDLNINNIVLG